MGIWYNSTVNVTRKCQYALRAVYELAEKYHREFVPVSSIAAAQVIPLRFLETIFAELRRAGIVSARRGVGGGYVLSVPPAEISVGQIIRLIDGSLSPVSCAGDDEFDCPRDGRCVFLPMWNRAREAVSHIYDETTFADLIRIGQELARETVADYCI